MRRVLLIILLSCTGLVLLAAVGIGVLLATFNPNAYTAQISEAVEKSTGRQLQFQGDIVMSLFPTLSLNTGRLVMNDPAAFGGGTFITVESASASLAVQPLLQGIVQIEEINLRGPVLHLLTTAAGQNNWDYGFGSGKNGKEVRQTAVHADAAGGRVVPLADPAKESGRKQGFFSRLLLQADRFNCRDGRVVYQDLRSGAFYSGRLDNVTMDSVRRDTDMPFAIAGGLADETAGRSLRFSLSGTARHNSSGELFARFDALDVTAIGLTTDPMIIKNKVEVCFDPAKRSLEIRSLKGNLDKTVYGGNIVLNLPEGDTPAQITGALSVNGLNVDELMHRLTQNNVFSGGSDEKKGAPNLTRPKIAPGREKSLPGQANAGTAPAQEESLPEKKTGAAPALAGMNANLAVDVTTLTLNKLPVSKFSFILQAEKGNVSIPFSLETLDGKAKGTARLDLRKTIPALALAATARGMNIEKLCRALAAKTTVSGTLTADVDLNGQGGSWKELAPTLKGKISLQLLQGEVRGFSLIPSNLRGIKDVPAEFPYERVSGSGTIERGILSSKDISLQSKLLTGAGGGAVNLVLEQVDLGIDFMIAGVPPAIPVNITGPFNAVASSVDVRTMMRNTAEGILTTPESAKDLLKDAGKLLRR